MKRRTLMGIAGCLSVVLFSGGCKSGDSGGEAAADVSIEDTVWEMTTYLSVSGTMDPRVDKSMVNLTIADGKISGNAGANKFFGGVELDGTSIKLSPMGSSMMMGTPELMAQEGQFLKHLGETVSYQIVGEELRMKNADGNVVLIFIPRIEPSLTSNVWKAVGVNNGKGGVSSLRKGTEITIEFNDEGNVFGHSGCNSFSGGYELKGNAVQFSPMAGTRKMCAEPEGVMEQETAFLQALEKSSVWKIKEGSLELRDETGALQAKFNPTGQ